MQLPRNSFKPIAANSESYLRLIATMGVDRVYPLDADMQLDGCTTPADGFRVTRAKARRSDPLSKGGKRVRGDDDN